MNKRLLYGGLAVILTVGLMAAFLREKPEEYEFPPPEEVVRQYFTTWNDEDYVNMYATISDGFKRIEPTASTLQDFKAYVEAQGVEEVIIHTIQEQSNDGITAQVNYDVTFGTGEGTIPFQGTFTLKDRQGDIIRGWKLIHPYGDKVDTS